MRKALFTLLLFSSYYGQAQRTNPVKARNAIYFEVLGSGGLYSINYERLFSVRSKQAYGFRVGTSFLFTTPKTTSLIGELFTVVGANNHHADFGIGLTGVSGNNSDVLAATSSKQYLYAVPRLSYRYQKPSGGTMFRAGFTPFVKLIADNNSEVLSPWIGLALGHSF